MPYLYQLAEDSWVLESSPSPRPYQPPPDQGGGVVSQGHGWTQLRTRQEV